MPSRDELQRDLEFAIMTGMVLKGSTILEVGCCEGDLLEQMAAERGVRAYGIEENNDAIYECVEKGLSVMHDDLENGLNDYPDKAFDYVVLDKSFARVRVPDRLIAESLRVGKQVIVNFANFGHWRVRGQVFFGGVTPVTGALPYQWYNTPNIHFLSVKDFLGYCAEKKVTVEQAVYVSGTKKVTLWPNLLSQSALFLIRK